MKKLFCFVALVGLASFLTSCDNPQSKTKTVEFSQPQVVDTIEGQELGGGILIKFITGTSGTDHSVMQRGTDHSMMQAEIQRQLEEFINGGQYEIVRVSITRCTRTSAHIIAAIVYYRLKSN